MTLDVEIMIGLVYIFIGAIFSYFISTKIGKGTIIDHIITALIWPAIFLLGILNKIFR